MTTFICPLSDKYFGRFPNMKYAARPKMPRGIRPLEVLREERKISVGDTGPLPEEYFAEVLATMAKLPPVMFRVKEVSFNPKIEPLAAIDIKGGKFCAEPYGVLALGLRHLEGSRFFRMFVLVHEYGHLIAMGHDIKVIWSQPDAYYDAYYGSTQRKREVLSETLLFWWAEIGGWRPKPEHIEALRSAWKADTAFVDLLALNGQSVDALVCHERILLDLCEYPYTIQNKLPREIQWEAKAAVLSFRREEDFNPQQDIADAIAYYILFGAHYRMRMYEELLCGNSRIAHGYLFLRANVFSGREYGLRKRCNPVAVEQKSERQYLLSGWEGDFALEVEWPTFNHQWFLREGAT